MRWNCLIRLYHSFLCSFKIQIVNSENPAVLWHGKKGFIQTFIQIKVGKTDKERYLACLTSSDTPKLKTCFEKGSLHVNKSFAARRVMTFQSCESSVVPNKSLTVAPILNRLSWQMPIKKMPYLLFSPQLLSPGLIQASCPLKLAQNKSISVFMSLSSGMIKS